MEKNPQIKLKYVAIIGGMLIACRKTLTHTVYVFVNTKALNVSLHTVYVSWNDCHIIKVVDSKVATWKYK
jgi:hypothetical protein